MELSIHLAYSSRSSWPITHASQGSRSCQLRIRWPGLAGSSSPCSCQSRSQSCAVVARYLYSLNPSLVKM